MNTSLAGVGSAGAEQGEMVLSGYAAQRSSQLHLELKFVL